jgi:hypothetical protein
MWSFWKVYLTLGFEHITDPNGYDHMLFLLALAAPYLWLNKKSLIWLVTAFTLGHSLTLALAVLDIFRMDPEVVEILIPITILFTAFFNVFILVYKKQYHPIWKYAITAFFGLIHGLGFYTFFREMITDNLELAKALFAFNLGLEIGQIITLSAIVLLSYLLSRLFKWQAHIFHWAYSILAILISFHLLFGQSGVISWCNC